MKPGFFFVGLLALAFAGCASPRKQSAPVERATYASAEDYSKLLLHELREFGAVEFSGRGLSSGSHHKVRQWSCDISQRNFKPEQLHDAAEMAAKKWKGYSGKTYSGGENRFEMSYGAGMNYVFINIVAYSIEGKTRVDVYIAIVE